ncbi:hypothetical protein SEMRO_1815_G299370.1 [Seminavis robusta]|uniref:Uncharacterized protein n=1 Tax=Seminavis robusta TaxID=568900 RepID=A0A9N8ESG7_9STRA|nr:hypothetical protein SEMRO_1815_G299370.1 [Seminavis robusta]|eukprot:Sro1815_g299370.1 n/a (380) ;mRNA; r:2434-3659
MESSNGKDCNQGAGERNTADPGTQEENTVGPELPATREGSAEAHSPDELPLDADCIQLASGSEESRKQTRDQETEGNPSGTREAGEGTEQVHAAASGTARISHSAPASPSEAATLMHTTLLADCDEKSRKQKYEYRKADGSPSGTREEGEDTGQVHAAASGAARISHSAPASPSEAVTLMHTTLLADCDEKSRKQNFEYRNTDGSPSGTREAGDDTGQVYAAASGEARISHSAPASPSEAVTLIHTTLLADCDEKSRKQNYEYRKTQGNPNGHLDFFAGGKEKECPRSRDNSPRKGGAAAAAANNGSEQGVQEEDQQESRIIQEWDIESRPSHAHVPEPTESPGLQRGSAVQRESNPGAYAAAGPDFTERWRARGSTPS